MKKYTAAFSATSYFLILLLFSQTFIQISFANHPPGLQKQPGNYTEKDATLPPANPNAQDEVFDAATRNFLNGLSGTRKEVALIVIETVNRAGGKVVGVGSWVSGKKYLDPLLGGTSDHDLRVVFEGSEELATARYRTLRREIVSRVNQKFGANAGTVLKSINLYPPEIILEGIDDAVEALQKLQKLGINPNLGDAVTEGLWGKGAKSFRDAYEAKAGRVFWKEGNTVRSGFADLLPSFGENAGIYTIQGSANTANQFADKVDDALRAGDAKSVRKNLQRLRDSLKKGRDLGRFNQTSYLDDLLKRLDNCCKNDLTKLAAEIDNPAFRQSLSSGLQRAKFEAELLLRYAAESNPQNIQILRDMLQTGTGKWARVKDAFLQYGGKVAEIGGKVRWDLALKGFFAVLTAYQVYDYYKKITEADLEGLLQNALLDATLLVSANFVIGFVPLILKAIMDDAIDYGYALITGQQDCQDLIAGIYEVKGRESLDVNQRAERSVEQLATEFTEVSKVEAIVALHAKNAATRNGKEDPKAEKILYDRCSSEIVNRWRIRRIEIISDAIELLKKIESDFNSLEMIGSVNPQEVWLLNEQKSTVNAHARLIGNASQVQQKIAEFSNKIKSLGGKDKTVAVSINHRYQWIPGVEDTNLASPDSPIFDNQKASEEYTFDYPGQIPLKFEYTLEIKVQTVADDVFSIAGEGHLDRVLTKNVSFEVNVLSPQGTVEIIAPGQAETGKPVNLTAKLDQNLSKLKDLRLVWHNLSDSSIPKTGSSYTFSSGEGGAKNVRLEVYAKINGEDVNIAQAEKIITIESKDKKDEKVKETAEVKPSPSPVPDAPPKVEVSKLMFGGTSSDIWEGVSDEKGFRLKRQGVKSRQGSDGCDWDATISAEVWGKFSPSFAPNTPAELALKIKEFAEDAKGWGKTTAIRDYSIGDFKGQIADNSVRFAPGGWSSDAGFRPSGVSVEGRGWILRDGRPIEIGYSVGGRGCWNNTDRVFLERQAAAAQNEAIAIINSLTLTGGNFAKFPYKGPKLDGSDMPTLEIVISPDKKKLKKGEVVDVRAVVKNVSTEDAPIAYTWTGDHAGKGETVKFVADKPGKYVLSVAAVGAKYPIGSASVEFEIADLRAEIKQVSPQTKITVGVPVSFSVELLSEGKPASGNYIYRFQPSPGVEFETNDSAAKQTKAIFSKPGREGIWVQVLEKKGNTLETVAESEQIEIEIIEPELKITFDQEKALVGKAVKAKVDVVPADLKNIDFRWEISSNAKQTLESRDGKEVTFIPQDNKPVTVKVSARVPVSGEDLGKKEATITAQQFDVKVEVLGTIGAKPRIFVPGKGLVTLDTGIAVFQNVDLKATVSPAAENLRYRWTLNEDSHFVGGSISAETTVNRSQIGTCEATVIVTDKDGIELGRGSGTFNVSISQDEINNSSKLAESIEKTNQSKDLARKGEIEEAIKLAEDAALLDPKNTEAKTLSAKLKLDKETIDTQLEKTRQLISQSKFPEAQKELIAAKNLNPYYKPVIELENELGEKWRKFDSGIQEGFGNIRLATENKDFKKALDLVQKLRTEFQLTPANQKELNNYEYFAKSHEAEKQRQREILAQGETKFNQGDYAGAIKDFDVMFPNFNAYWNGNIDPEPKKYGDLKAEAGRRQKRITELVPNIKRTIEQNSDNDVLLKTALANLEELLGFQPNNTEFQNYRMTINDLLQRKGNEAKINSIIASGDNFYKEKKYANAIKEYDNVIKIDPNNAEAFRKRAMANRENGNDKDALRDFNKSIKLVPNNYQTHLGRGLVHREMKNFKEAMTDFNRGIELNPKYANGYFYRGHLKLTQNEDYKGAIADFDYAIKLDPKSSAAYINRGLAKSRLGDDSGAVLDYNQAITVDPKNSMAHNNRGTIKEKQADLKGAKADYEKAVELDPGNKLAKSNLDKLNAKLSDSQTPTATKPTPQPTVGKTEVEITNITNIYGVANKPTVPTTFTVSSSYMVTFIETYHWNNAAGTAVPGTIALRHSNGTVYGPWKATGRAGQGGVKNAYWAVKPNVIIPAGTYTIVDSDPSTWSHNTQSGGKGFVTVKGYTVSGTASPPTVNQPTTTEKMTISITYINASKQNVHLFAQGETFSPDNRLAPGGRRVASGTGPKFTRITVYAGVDGKVIDQLSFDVLPNGDYSVTFGSNNKLSLGQGSGNSNTSANTDQKAFIYLKFVNNSKVSMHILAPGENFSSENLLKPGQSRNVSINYSGRARLGIMAYKPDGKYDQSIEFLVEPNGKYTVTFGSDNKLTSKILN
jgi:tetratricopeptide (TPR) repeat protein